MKDGKKCILVADDEAAIREILTLLLSGEGYAVTQAEDGQAVLELASDDIDLYILDVNMPRMTGIQAAAELRKRWETPIMFLTAYSGESDKVLGFSVGADDYMVKPFSNMELLMRVKAILRRRVGAVSGVGAFNSGVSNEVKNQIDYFESSSDILGTSMAMLGNTVFAFAYNEDAFKNLNIENLHIDKLNNIGITYD